MFKGAVENWRKKCTHWQIYCERENEKKVNPILVVQVEDGSEREATHTDLGICIELLEETLGRKLHPGEAVHTFNDRGTLNVREVEIQRIEASRVEDDENAIVVFFKMNLSTGWDCPRAETMQAPSAGNQQSSEFLVVQDKAALGRLSEMSPYSKMVAKAPLAIVLLGNTERMKFPGNWEQDLGAAAENLLLEAAELGLGAVWLGVHPMRITPFGNQRICN